MKEIQVTVKIKKDQAVTDSLIVAENFGKLHKNILQSIDVIKGQISTADFSALFYETTYVAENGKRNRKYLMNKNGFSLLVMGFTGDKAMQWKLAYIAEFDRMTEIIAQQATIGWQNTRVTGKQTRSVLTSTLQQLVGYATAQHYGGAKWTYSQYTKLVNKALGIRQDDKTRDHCTTKQLLMIDQLEEALCHVINNGMAHNAAAGEIYRKCKQYCNHYLNMLFLDSPFKPAELK